MDLRRLVSWSAKNQGAIFDTVSSDSLWIGGGRKDKEYKKK